MKASIRRWMVLFLSLIILVSLTADLSAAEKLLTILHVNDTHSHLDAFGPKGPDLGGTLGGIAKAAFVIGAQRQLDPDALLLHAGDIFTGDFFFNKYMGVPELQLLAQLGFDAMTVGNHEFDLGPGGLLAVLAAAFAGPEGSPLPVPPLPILSANLDYSGCQDESIQICTALESIIQPSTVIERPGTNPTDPPLKIGIFGMTIPGLPVTQSGDIAILEDVFAIAGQTIQALRDPAAEKRADLVIFLSHLGSLYDRAIAENVPGIDIIVGGHDHYVFEQPLSVTNLVDGGKTLIVQAGEFYKHVGKLTVSVNIPDGGSEDVTVALKSYQLIPVNTTVPAASVVQTVVDYLKAGIVKQYGDVYEDRIGFAFKGIEKDYDPTCPFRDTGAGNLVTDAFRKRTKADIAFTANGFISEKIYPGVIVPADVLRTVPYGANPLTGKGLGIVKLRLTGEQILVGIEYTLGFAGVSDTFMLQVSGMRFAYNAGQPVGKRLIRGSARIDGKPVKPKAVYSVAVNAGMASLMEQLMGIKPLSKELKDFDEYAALRDYISDRGTIHHRSQGRILEFAAHRR